MSASFQAPVWWQPIVVLLPKLFGTVERTRLQAQLSPVRLLSQLLGFLLKHTPSVPAPVPCFLCFCVPLVPL